MKKRKALIYGGFLALVLLLPCLSKERFDPWEFQATSKPSDVARFASVSLNRAGAKEVGSMPAAGDEYWDDRFGPYGVNGSVYAIAVSGSDVYIGGDFTTAGAVTVDRVAKWDGSSWSALGSGMDGTVFALAVSGSTLFAGGNFWTAGGVSVNRIAKWDGSNWSALGSGMNDYVLALAVSGSTLYAGGWFSRAGGVTANCIAKWDGSSWSALGSGMNLIVNALAVSGTTLYAGGWFSIAGGVSANYIARWDGTNWSPVGAGMNSPVFALAASGPTLYAGGQFTTAGNASANYIAKWDGSGWSALGSGVNNYVLALAAGGFTLYAGGQFSTAGGAVANCIAKWDGSSWSALGSGVNNYVRALAVSLVNAYVGGDFTQAGGKSCYHFGRWSGGTSIARKTVDFNSDGQDDILWRYTGAGGYNTVWYMGSSKGVAAGVESCVMNKSMSLRKTTEMSQEQGQEHIFVDAPIAMQLEERGGRVSKEAKRERDELVMMDPSEIGGVKHNTFSVIRVATLMQLGWDYLPSVADTNWQIEGTGDFNSDGKVDILWRHYGSPGGFNTVWYMDGMTVTGSANLPAVTDTNWKIAGTGDFNSDGKVDILWRNYGSPGGFNAVWYMDGMTVIASTYLPTVTDINWRIVAAGDFDGDGKVDILWRYYGSPGGYNAVWYMDGPTLIGWMYLPWVIDTNWEIGGTGDYNHDGKADILWRYYGSPGGYNIVWFMNSSTVTGLEYLPAVTETSWRIVNR